MSTPGTKVYVGSVLCTCIGFPYCFSFLGEARLIAIDTWCSNLSWNTTDDVLRAVSCDALQGVLFCDFCVLSRYVSQL